MTRREMKQAALWVAVTLAAGTVLGLVIYFGASSGEERSHEVVGLLTNAVTIRLDDGSAMRVESLYGDSIEVGDRVGIGQNSVGEWEVERVWEAGE